VDEERANVEALRKHRQIDGIHRRAAVLHGADRLASVTNGMGVLI